MSFAETDKNVQDGNKDRRCGGGMVSKTDCQLYAVNSGDRAATNLKNNTARWMCLWPTYGDACDASGDRMCGGGLVQWR